MSKRILIVAFAVSALGFVAPAFGQMPGGSYPGGSSYGTSGSAPMPDVESRPGVGYQPHGAGGGNSASASAQSVHRVREAKDVPDDGGDHSADEWVQKSTKKDQ